MLNIPVETVAVDPHKSFLPKTGTIVAVSDENVVVEAVKRSEDRKATVIRLYESSGAYLKAVVRPGFPASEMSIANPPEENPVPLKIKDGAVELDFHPFEIKAIYAASP